MSKSIISVGVTILDIVGFPINALPDGESTEIIQQIQICPAGTAAAPGVGSNAGVRDFETTQRIMQAGSMKILEENS